MRWYYTPPLGADLSQGFENFVKHDDSVDEHLDSLLKTIMAHEKQTGKKIDAQIVTWRGCITKVRGGRYADVSKGAGSQLTDYGESFRRPRWVCVLVLHSGDPSDS